jgi:hypothetical protein
MPNKHKRVLLSALLILTLSPAVIAFQNCERASELNNKAFQRHLEDAPLSELKGLLNRALKLCPSHPESHNNLADMLREEGQYI